MPAEKLIRDFDNDQFQRVDVSASCASTLEICSLIIVSLILYRAMA